MNQNIKWALIAAMATLAPIHVAMANDIVDGQRADQDKTQSDATHAADNTALNARDRDDTTTLPTDQPNNQADIDVAAAVRSAIVDDESLSMAAHNIKLVAADGVVVLRGPVESLAEKNKISEIAKRVNGVTSVKNLLEIKTH